jgi:hypothetical protein
MYPGLAGLLLSILVGGALCFAAVGVLQAAVGYARDQVRDQLAGMLPKIGPLMDDAKVEVLAFTAFPRPHWQKVWSTNPLDTVPHRRAA